VRSWKARTLPTISEVSPDKAVEGARVVVHGSGFSAEAPPLVRLGGQPALVAFVSPTRMVVLVPSEVEGENLPLEIENDGASRVEVGVPWATGLHQVDNPAFDREGRLYVTYSGPRGQEAPVSVFRVATPGAREPFVSGIVNATSLAFGPDGDLYVSSRFDGAVYQVAADGTHTQVASELGVACGLAFDGDGWMYVGDRSGTIFRVRDGAAQTFATVPPSVAAFHLAMSPWGELFVSAPTLGTYDYIYRIGAGGEVRTLPHVMGRPQGLAFSPDGLLHVTDALAGAGGLYRFRDLDGEPELVVSGNALVGVAFGPSGELSVASNDTAYRFGSTSSGRA
jgi:sugar lactone lactonase YvrE